MEEFEVDKEEKKKTRNKGVGAVILKGVAQQRNNVFTVCFSFIEFFRVLLHLLICFECSNIPFFLSFTMF